MDFDHLPFYSRDLTQKDVHRVPQPMIPIRLYKFAYARETNLEQDLVLEDKILLEELVELIRFARRRRDAIAAVRDRDRHLERLFEEMAEVQALAEAEDVAAAPGAGAGALYDADIVF
ncbi:uncharacterized protein LOC113298818 [Papaver somniferum]|uniref:uncharacterized protein LOC113298818 n=1 Tax=Papaver somniferum TaxID=3469 RepID=UPI000E6FE42E|nr:uncharacterized protein LOC113298818 [Papaver somniferum]